MGKSHGPLSCVSAFGKPIWPKGRHIAPVGCLGLLLFVSPVLTGIEGTAGIGAIYVTDRRSHLRLFKL